MTDATLEDRLKHEIEELHAFLAAWFRGDLAREHALFERALTARCDPQMVNIQPSGASLTLAELSKGIYAGHGSNPAFEISIYDFKLLSVSPDGRLAVATYLEAQRNARNTTPTDNNRVSTVVFAISSNDAPRWLHIHETATQIQ